MAALTRKVSPRSEGALRIGLLLAFLLASGIWGCGGDAIARSTGRLLREQPLVAANNSVSGGALSVLYASGQMESCATVNSSAAYVGFAVAVARQLEVGSGMIEGSPAAWGGGAMSLSGSLVVALARSTLQRFGRLLFAGVVLLACGLAATAHGLVRLGGVGVIVWRLAVLLRKKFTRPSASNRRLALLLNKFGFKL